MKTLLSLVLVLLLMSCCTLDKGEKYFKEKLYLLRVEGTQICVLIFNAREKTAMLRVDCDEIPNPIVVPLEQSIESEGKCN